MEYGDTAPLLPGNTGKNPCGCTTRNSIRRSAISLVQWWGFDAFILMIIGCNTIMMMTDSPLDTDETSDKAMIIAKMELIFNCIFTIEMSIKITALGCSDYVKDPWNLLDATVVTSAWAPYFLPTSGNYSWLRAVRVLRALRTVNRLPSLKALVNTLLSFETLQGLSNVSVLFCFFLFLFGILGVNMFAGKLHFRCTEPGSSEWVDDTAVCATSADCEGEQTCEYYEINPADGALSYDNVLYPS